MFCVLRFCAYECVNGTRGANEKETIRTNKCMYTHTFKPTWSAALPICRSQRAAASVLLSVALRERKALCSQS